MTAAEPVYCVVFTDSEISKLLAILEGAEKAAGEMQEPEVSDEIGRLAGILSEARI